MEGLLSPGQTTAKVIFILLRQDQYIHPAIKECVGGKD
jgi:hypothetical protein